MHPSTCIPPRASLRRNPSFDQSPPYGLGPSKPPRPSRITSLQLTPQSSFSPGPNGDRGLLGRGSRAVSPEAREAQRRGIARHAYVDRLLLILTDFRLEH